MRLTPQPVVMNSITTSGNICVMGSFARNYNKCHCVSIKTKHEMRRMTFMNFARL